MRLATDTLIALPLIPITVAAVLDWPFKHKVENLPLVLTGLAIALALFFNQG